MQSPHERSAGYAVVTLDNVKDGSANWAVFFSMLASSTLSAVYMAMRSALMAFAIPATSGGRWLPRPRSVSFA